MKKILLFGLVVAAGILGYTHFLNARPASTDEKALADLEHQFDAANQQMAMASRSAGVSGMDSTADVEASRTAVRRVESELQALKERLTSTAARERADRLQEKIRAFRAATD